MFIFYFILIAFIVEFSAADNHDEERERCRSNYTRWSKGNTKYISLKYKEDFYAYPLCERKLSRHAKVKCVNGYYENPLPQCENVLLQQCESLPISNHLVKNCERGALSVGKSCSFRCLKPYKLQGSSKRVCGANLQWTGKKSSCVLENDIDECGINNGACSDICNNYPGGYYCSCPEGFFLNADRKTCSDIDECGINNGACSDTCNNYPGGYYCSCPEGFFLNSDRKTCSDIDECQSLDLNHCNQICSNTVGSYLCSCEPGYILKNRYECEGCRKNSYRSEDMAFCEDCPPNSSTDSGFKTSKADCSCNTGFWGDPSHHISREDINECVTNNFGCSDTCVNTPGAAYCSCPLGFKLASDDKTCVDIDECTTRNGGCQMHCQNSIGNFSCYCSKGLVLSEDGYSCIDSDECAKNNGGCSDLCINFDGGFYCACPKGFRLDVEGKKCIAIRCPALAVPHHSSLRCFSKAYTEKRVILKPNEELYETDYPVHTLCRLKCDKGFKLPSSFSTAECLDNGTWNSSLPECIISQCPPLIIPENGDVYPPVCIEGPVFVYQKCYFTCKPGYKLNKKRQMLKCRNNLKWTEDPPSCEFDGVVPFITCPDDITVDLKPNEIEANVTISRPHTNVEEVEIFPDWITVEEPMLFPSGKTDVLFKISSPITNKTIQCILTVNVVDREPPKFLECPESFVVSNAGSHGILVNWEDPIAIDNIGVQSMSSNLKPNTTLTAGLHFISYIAEDAVGNLAQCSFEINVTRGYCENLEDPENGKANCIDWMSGKLCRPACEPGYSRDSNEPKFFACADSGIWTPTDVISPCLAECLNGTVWTSVLNKCE